MKAIPLRNPFVGPQPTNSRKNLDLSSAVSGGNEPPGGGDIGGLEGKLAGFEGEMPSI